MYLAYLVSQMYKRINSFSGGAAIHIGPNVELYPQRVGAEE